MSDEDNVINVVIEYPKNMNYPNVGFTIPINNFEITDSFNVNQNVNKKTNNLKTNILEKITFKIIKHDLKGYIDSNHPIVNLIKYIIIFLKNVKKISEIQTIIIDFTNTYLKGVDTEKGTEDSDTTYEVSFNYEFIFPDTMEVFIKSKFFYGIKNLTLTLPKNVKYLGSELFTEQDNVFINKKEFTNSTPCEDYKEFFPELVFIGTGLYKQNPTHLYKYINMNEDFFNILYYGVNDTKLNIFHINKYFIDREKLENKIIIPSVFTELYCKSIMSFYNCDSYILDFYQHFNSLTAKGLTEIKKDSPINSFINLTHLCLPKVNNIEGECFTNLTNLTHLDLPRLERDIFLTSIYNGGINLVNLKLGITTITNSSPINSFTNLTHLCLPNVKTISDDCFKNLKKLTHLELPRLESIGKNCFSNTRKLDYLDLSGIPITEAKKLLENKSLLKIKPIDNQNIKYINQCITKKGKPGSNHKTLNMNFDCGTPSGGQKYFAPGDILKTTITKIKIGPEVTKINNNLFEGFVNLKEIDFTQAENLEKIGDDAFKDCIKLKKLDLKDAEKLETIGERAFQDCTSLNPDNIILPYKITKREDVTTIKTNIKEGITIYITNNNDNNDNNELNLGGGYRKPKLQSKKNNKKRRKNKTNKKARGGYKKLSKNTRKMNKYGKMKIKKKFSKIKK